MATIIQAKQRGKHDRHQRWARLERADLFERHVQIVRLSIPSVNGGVRPVHRVPPPIQRGIPAPPLQ
jgi:hypothetical protein